MFQKMKASFQKGISLLEVMLSLSIIAIILVMATRYFFSANTSQKVNQEVIQIHTLSSAIEKWKATSGAADYSTVSLVAVAPMDPNWDGTNLKSLWGDNITLAPGATSSTYTIEMPLPSASICSSLVASFKSGAACNVAAFTYTGPST